MSPTVVSILRMHVGRMMRTTHYFLSYAGGKNDENSPFWMLAYIIINLPTIVTVGFLSFPSEAARYHKYIGQDDEILVMIWTWPLITVYTVRINCESARFRIIWTFPALWTSLTGGLLSFLWVTETCWKWGSHTPRLPDTPRIMIIGIASKNKGMFEIVQYLNGPLFLVDVRKALLSSNFIDIPIIGLHKGVYTWYSIFTPYSCTVDARRPTILLICEILW